MATIDGVDSEIIATVATLVKFNLYFTNSELERMLGNTKAGGYTAVRIETNGGATTVDVVLR